MAATVETVETPRWAQRVANPVVRRLLRSPGHRLLGRYLMLLTVTGRRTGRRITVPVGRHELDGQVLCVAQGRWRVNLRGGAPVELLLDGRRRTGHGELVEDPDAVARVIAQLVARLGTAGAQRRLGIVVRGDGPPSHEELRAGLGGRKAVVRVTLDPA